MQSPLHTGKEYCEVSTREDHSDKVWYPVWHFPFLSTWFLCVLVGFWGNSGSEETPLVLGIPSE